MEDFGVINKLIQKYPPRALFIPKKDPSRVLFQLNPALEIQKEHEKKYDKELLDRVIYLEKQNVQLRMRLAKFVIFIQMKKARELQGKIQVTNDVIQKLQTKPSKRLDTIIQNSENSDHSNADE